MGIVEEIGKMAWFMLIALAVKADFIPFYQSRILDADNLY